MNDDLLKYYNRELAFIRHMGSNFATEYPKLAGRLKLSDENIEDPHVSRLIEGFSLLTAQIRQKLDDSFPELTDALLGQLYPDYQAPIPSMSVIQLETQSVSTTGVNLPKGSKIETIVDGMKPCHFQTCYDTQLWPLNITEAKFNNAPFLAPKATWKKTAKAVIKISIECEYDEVDISTIGIDKLRFYINGQPHQTYALYELLFKHCIGMSIAKRGDISKAVYLQPRHLQSVGFENEEKVVPYSIKTLSGYRYLVEKFILPEKFLFFDIEDLKNKWTHFEDKIDLYLYLDEASEDLEKQVTKSHFLLGCTPIVNLFEHELEPVRIEPSLYEYKLCPRYLDSEVSEIINIQQVTAFDPKDNKIPVQPFYGEAHPAYSAQKKMFWNIRRETSNWAGGYAEQGLETYLSLIDHTFKGFDVSDSYGTWLLSIKAMCSNRNLPAHLPFGTGEPKMFNPNRADIIKNIKCLVAPTKPVRAEFKDATRWQLISHINLDYFTSDDAANKLKQLLFLYDFKNAPENKSMISNIHQVQIKPAVSRINQNGRISFCSGSEVLITFSGDDYSGSGVFFFTLILDRFFAQFAAINSFTQVVVQFKGHDEIYHTWPSRTGLRPLL
ncbi:type VI secretion system baseplate subunit TssF [Pseudoalteromonas sp. C2R02]|uniref:type VI secretion system baseplate subunit TssF n=1 Tax=Pseudoalteromonas sp. C2R02 TaxID=2841565 RepID=UPI001C08CBE5|nr:type VI secretion system baseplate subunit TssF [Pseudoalteromonas sp. C2R02]MBU2968404.1 type VI secretion system baseplate subunit TssF [Pseudoalteromonas sp. C2R02]